MCTFVIRVIIFIKDSATSHLSFSGWKWLKYNQTMRCSVSEVKGIVQNLELGFCGKVPIISFI